MQVNRSKEMFKIISALIRYHPAISINQIYLSIFKDNHFCLKHPCIKLRIKSYFYNWLQIRNNVLFYLDSYPSRLGAPPLGVPLSSPYLTGVPFLLI